MGNRVRDPWDGRFVGERVDVESVPRLSATLVAAVVAENRRLRLSWQPQVQGGSRDSALLERGGDGWAVVRERDGLTVRLEVVERPLPRRGGRAPFLRCPSCSRLVRHLYGWRRIGHHRVVRAFWPCRVCAGLRYASEGWRNPWSAWAGPRGRDPWEPDVRRA